MTDLDRWRAGARAWLVEASRDVEPDPRSFAIFHNLDPAEERAMLDRSASWQRTKLAAGYGAITWPSAYGGAGLPEEYEFAFREEEAAFDVPRGNELVSVTLDLVAPTILEHGTDSQRDDFLPAMLRGERWVCQLFSEPDAGSDLAALRTRATPDGDNWVIDGQKVWTSGARFASDGLLIARTDPGSKHGGLTAFLVPLDAAGVRIEPIRQMTGGGTFNEVFLDRVRVPDTLRLGAVGDGWAVTMTTLRHERASSGWGAAQVGAQVADVIAAARERKRTDDPLVRTALADLWSTTKLQSLFAARVRQLAIAGKLGFEGSILKLLWVENMSRTSRLASMLLGPSLVADDGTGGWAWSEHVLGAPGYRIAGGSDEIQRNIVAERLLGLPR